MHRTAFVAMIVAAAAAVAGCGNIGRGAAARYLAEGEYILHGPNIWVDAEADLRYKENEPVNREKAETAIVTQKYPAPYKPGEPVDGATTPLTLEAVADNMLRDFKVAIPLAEGELTYETMAKLEQPAEDLLLHAREITTIFERQALNMRLESLRPKPEGPAPEPAGASEQPAIDPKAQMAALEEWLDVAQRIERSANWFMMGTLKRMPAQTRKGWEALTASCKQLPQVSSGMEMLLIKFRKK